MKGFIIHVAMTLVYSLCLALANKYIAPQQTHSVTELEEVLQNDPSKVVKLSQLNASHIVVNNRVGNIQPLLLLIA